MINNHFICTICGKQFTRRDNLNRHIKCHQQQQNNVCQWCGLQFSRRDVLRRHLQARHQQQPQQNNADQQEDEILQRPDTGDILDIIEEYEVTQQQQQVPISEENTQPLSAMASSHGVPPSLIPSTIPNTNELADIIDVDILNESQRPNVPFRSVDMDLTPSDAQTQYQIDDISTGELEEMRNVFQWHATTSTVSQDGSDDDNDDEPQEIIDVDALSTPESSAPTTALDENGSEDARDDEP